MLIVKLFLCWNSSALTATRVTHMVGANLSGSKAEKVLKVLSFAIKDPYRDHNLWLTTLV